MSRYKSNVCCSVIITVKLGGVPGPNNRVGHTVQPKKRAEFLLHMLKNAESNAELKGLDVDSLVIEHIQVNRAPKMQPRTYRAHGCINPYSSSPCNREMILTEKKHPRHQMEATHSCWLDSTHLWLDLTLGPPVCNLCHSFN